jgi:hypothetical protein
VLKKEMLFTDTTANCVFLLRARNYAWLNKSQSGSHSPLKQKRAAPSKLLFTFQSFPPCIYIHCCGAVFSCRARQIFNFEVVVKGVYADVAHSGGTRIRKSPKICSLRILFPALTLRIVEESAAFSFIIQKHRRAGSSSAAAVGQFCLSLLSGALRFMGDAADGGRFKLKFGAI